MAEPASIVGWVVVGSAIWLVVIVVICVFFAAARRADERLSTRDDRDR